MSTLQTRRKYLKTRNGCLQCKRRRIKCDENGSISCAQCVKSRLGCSFAPPPAVDLSFSSATILDMELLHRFTTKTAVSLSNSDSIQTFFSTDFVQLALGNEYLLHCVLSLSAFHVVNEQGKNQQDSCKNAGKPTEKYLLAAYGHYDSALKEFRRSLSNLNSDTCHAIFGCAFLLFITALSRPPEIFSKSDRSTSETDADVWLDLQLSEWIILTKGLPSIVQQSELLQTLRQGPLAPLMTIRDNAPLKDNNDTKRNCMIYSRLDDLSRAIREWSSDDQIVETCHSSVKALQELLTEPSHNHDMSIAFLWPMRVNKDYLVFLGGRRPEALLVFAHYCALLHIMSSRWFTEGWPRSILESIRYTIDDKWIPWLEWPLEMVFGSQEESTAGLSEQLLCK